MKVEGEGTAATRCGFVALIGAPNVGKSTLVNAVVGEKVTIVSRKVQTTRALIRGIVVEGNAQIILVDTPGIFAPKRRLDRAMVITAWTGAHDADLVCVLLDAKLGLDAEADAIFAKLADCSSPEDSRHQQDRSGGARKAAGAGAGRQRAHGVPGHLHDLGVVGRRHRRFAQGACRSAPGGPVPLSGRPDVGGAAAPSCC